MSNRNRTSHGNIMRAAFQQILATYGNVSEEALTTPTFGTTGGPEMIVCGRAKRGQRAPRTVVIYHYQGSRGSTEQKVFFDLVRAADAMRNDSSIQKAVVVLDGNGWSDRLLGIVRSGNLAGLIANGDRLQVVSRDEAIRLAREGALTA